MAASSADAENVPTRYELTHDDDEGEWIVTAFCSCDDWAGGAHAVASVAFRDEDLPGGKWEAGRLAQTYLREQEELARQFAAARQDVQASQGCATCMQRVCLCD